MVGQTELYRKKAKFQIDVRLRCLLISSRVLFFLFKLDKDMFCLTHF